MVSIKIESTEERSVFDEGYSGINPVKLGRAGRGLGLFVVQKLLALTDATIRLRRDVDPGMRRIYQGLPYEKNVFELDLPTAGG
jgi:K+-sensing histidine kinase KdpD